MVETPSTDSQAVTLTGHAIIAGFGVPGRVVADWLTQHHMPYVVIERNPSVVERCGRVGVPIIEGDVRDETSLKRAGIASASLLAITIPDEPTVLQAVEAAYKLNPLVKLFARCTFISGGLEAARRGATETVVAEEVVAREFVRLLDGGHASIRAHTRSE